MGQLRLEEVEYLRADGVIKMKTEDGTFEIRMRFGTLPFNPFNVVGRIL